MGENSTEQEEPHRVAYDLVYNENEQVIAVDIKIDESWHRVGKKELWDLKRIAETCFDTIFTQN